MKLSLLTLPALLLFGSCGDSAPSDPSTAQMHGPTSADSTAAVEIPSGLLAAFSPLPEHYHANGVPSSALIDLGRQLYYDPRLSSDNSVSCNTCHDLARFGVDGEPTSPGVGGGRGTRNSPTVYMAAGHLSQFWDGREPHVEAQAKGPILNPIEMAMPDAADVETKLAAIEGYVEAFASAFPGQAQPLNYDNLAIAIGSFERGLITPAPWDDFLAGNKQALTEAEKRGFLAFTKTGCQTCHMGPLLGGQMNQKLGLMRPWPNLTDQGIGDLTGNEAQNGYFKVPSLRNITQTGPYLHDGSVVDLGEMVRLMAKYQLDKELTNREVDDIVAFLGALEGKLDETYIAKPALP